MRSFFRPDVEAILTINKCVSSTYHLVRLLVKLNIINKYNLIINDDAIDSIAHKQLLKNAKYVPEF